MGWSIHRPKEINKPQAKKNLLTQIIKLLNINDKGKNLTDFRKDTLCTEKNQNGSGCSSEVYKLKAEQYPY